MEIWETRSVNRSCYLECIIMSSGRNPKDLRHMVNANQTGLEDMMLKLSKLNSLSADDKTENAMLRSRIDEQSELIMILKQRNDELSVKCQTLQRSNQEVEESLQSSADDLKMQSKKYNILDSRFHDLASNHEEMIQIKDDYKQRNEELRKENAKLLQENESCFSAALQEKDERILELEKTLTSLRDKCAALDQVGSDLSEKLRIKDNDYSKDVGDLRKCLQDKEEQLKGALCRLARDSERRAVADGESGKKAELLARERDELLNLAMQRGKLIQDKQTENKKLQEKLEAQAKLLRDAQDKFDREAAAVNVNVQVRRLRSELEGVEATHRDTLREFEAFKKHSADLLQREKDLNMKLRHLVG